LKKILLVMYRKLLSETLNNELSANSEFILRTEANYKSAPTAADVFLPDIVLLEIPETGENVFDECLSLANEIKAKRPSCRIMLLCPEGNALTRKATIKAVQRGMVNDFVYYDTSLKYLASKLEAL